jgi:predicted DNA-binding transcriptional regulator AlpA
MDKQPDHLVPDPQVCAELGITSMTLWRYDQDAKLKFPVAIKIRNRNYRSRKQLEAWKAELLSKAMKEHRQKLAG